MSETPKMTKGERVELGQLIRKRERVMKSYAAERAAQMLAEFDRQSAQIFAFDDDQVWAKATDEAKRMVDKSNKVIADRCRELGIPEEFAPSLTFGWEERGQNQVAGRRSELRRMAVSKISAIEAETITKIERLSLTAQTEVLAHGMESDAAKSFLENMPALETLMPSLDAAALKTLQDERRKR
jgi:hypothetical protein